MLKKYKILLLWIKVPAKLLNCKHRQGQLEQRGKEIEKGKQFQVTQIHNLLQFRFVLLVLLASSDSA